MTFFAGKSAGRTKILDIDGDDGLYLTLDQLDLIPEDILSAAKDRDVEQQSEPQSQRDQFK